MAEQNSNPETQESLKSAKSAKKAWSTPLLVPMHMSETNGKTFSYPLENRTPGTVTIPGFFGPS